MKFNTLAIFLLAITFNVAFSDTPDLAPDQKKEQLIGNIIKKLLETYHYKKVKIDDSFSSKAFGEFIKRIDFGKQFLLASDVKKLSKFSEKMDDQMVSGSHELLNMAISVMNERIGVAEKIRVKAFKKDFDFNTDEFIEVDAEKSTFAKDEKEFEDHWRKIFKHSTLNRYASLIEEQEELKNATKKSAQEKKKEDKKNKDKKNKEAKKTEILTDVQMRKKAHESVSKKYERFFERQLQEDRFDYLEKFYNSMATIFDPHTNYFPPKRKEDFDIDISGSLEGIGAVLQEEEGYIKVNKIVTGGAAWKQKGLEVDDKILAVSELNKEPVDIVGMRVEDAVRYIRGKKGTTVVLTVKKVEGSVKNISIERDVVTIRESFAKSSVIQIKGLDMKVGYIKLPKFYRDFSDGERNCTNDVREELRRLKKEKVDGIVLDLRNNGGGALEDARQMSGLFIKDGPIVQVRNHDGKIDVLSDTDKSVEYDGPLIVMINRFSASASEILAGALKDYGRAVIVGGEFSHGKGTVQAVLNLNQGPLSLFSSPMGALKVTIQKFYRVNGKSTQYKGVTPDIVLPDPYSYIENREQDLEYSLPWDSVKPLTYTPWRPISRDLTQIIAKSKQRVDHNHRYSKLIENSNYLKKRKNDTLVTLNLKKTLEENKKNDAMVEKFKKDVEIENKNLTVTNYEQSLHSREDVDSKDEKKWKEEFVERREEWISSLQKDVDLEEVMYIVGDMLGKKFRVINLADGGSSVESAN